MSCTEPHKLGNWFGPNVPSPNLPFPPSANITAVELLTFLPHSLKSHNVVNRLVSNGFTRNAIWTITNNNRDLEREWPANTCGITIYATMRSVGYDGWTVTIHDRWFKDEVKKKWNANSISVAGFQVPCQTEKELKNSFAPPIPFAQLVTDIRQLPKQSDALDLTRMVQYAVEHPDEGWMYPKHYDKLLSRLGGPMKVQVEHTDLHAYRRWQYVTAPPPSRRPSPLPKALGPVPLLQKRKERITKDSRPHPKRMRPKPSSPKENDEEYVEGVGQRTETRGFEEYIRPKPVLCPVPFVAKVSSDEEIKQAFRIRGDLTKPSAYSPYAFGGPRTSSPYRPLHFIDTPDTSDGSAWAENLRWAAEQLTNFLSAAVGWNESPEHLRLIDNYRREQAWVSDEWLEAYVEKQKEAPDGDWPPRRPKEFVSSPFMQPNPEGVEQSWEVTELGSPPRGGETFFD